MYKCHIISVDHWIASVSLLLTDLWWINVKCLYKFTKNKQLINTKRLGNLPQENYFCSLNFKWTVAWRLFLMNLDVSRRRNSWDRQTTPHCVDGCRFCVDCWSSTSVSHQSQSIVDRDCVELNCLTMHWNHTYNVLVNTNSECCVC